MPPLLIQNKEKHTQTMAGATTKEHAWVFMGKYRFHLAPAPTTELVHRFMGLWNPPFSPKNSPRLALGEYWLMGPPYSYPVHSSLLG